jgi:peptide/nickel transport system permease protein
MVGAILGVSVPVFLLAALLLYVFAFKLSWFPNTGYSGLSNPTQWAYHLILPWFTFACVFAALYARMIRASMLETMEEDYVRTARAKGASTSQVVRKHVLRNAMLPVVSMLGMDFGVAFAGALFIEQIFQLPGMGRLLVQSLYASDLPMILGIVLVVSVVVVCANLVVDVLYPLLDPRVRVSGRGGDGKAATRRVRRELRTQPQEATRTGELSQVQQA